MMHYVLKAIVPLKIEGYKRAILLVTNFGDVEHLKRNLI